MWYQLQIEVCQHDEVEHLSDLLQSLGALSVTFTDKNDDPVLEPEPGTTPLWPDVIVQALFDQESMAEVAMQHLMPQYPHLDFHIHELPNQDWERTWMDTFKPMCFGKKLWICPSWIEPPEPDAVNLILDPGLAFGTGTHPTTSLCLTWLDEALLANQTVIDYGCGSGVLALAALKLGANHVHAVDIDTQALTATANNAAINNIPVDKLAIGQPNSLTICADILIANILLAPLINLQERFYELLSPAGTLVVSGLLSEQAQELINAYHTHFIHRSSQHLDGWGLLVFQRR